MLRRSPLRLTLAMTAGAVALSGCATFTNTDRVAEVAGTTIDGDEFTSISQSYYETDLFFQQTDPGSTVDDRIRNGTVDANASRGLLTAVVRQRLLDEFLASQGVDNSSIRTEFQTVAIPQTPLADVEVDQTLLDLFTDSDGSVVSQSLALVSTPNIDALEEQYSTEPTSTGLVCVRHILLETEEEAEAVVGELAAGADFAELALARSLDEVSAADGGAITAPDNDCIALETVRQGFDPAFAAGIIGQAEGAVAGPVQSSFGWHVILTRPWSEVGESVGALLQPDAAGALLFAGYKATADVDIDPRYGSWNRLLEVVEPIG